YPVRPGKEDVGIDPGAVLPFWRQLSQEEIENVLFVPNFVLRPEVEMMDAAGVHSQRVLPGFVRAITESRFPYMQHGAGVDHALGKISKQAISRMVPARIGDN